jgi:hypothetical protein
MKNDDVLGFAVAYAETDSGTDGVSVSVMGTVSLAADDYIRAALTTDSATSITIISAGLHMELIDPA